MEGHKREPSAATASDVLSQVVPECVAVQAGIADLGVRLAECQSVLQDVPGPLAWSRLCLKQARDALAQAFGALDRIDWTCRKTPAS